MSFWNRHCHAILMLVAICLAGCETGSPTMHTANGNIAPPMDDASYSWRAMGDGLPNYVNDFVLYRGNLLAGGAPNTLSRWTGSAWETYAGGVNGPILAMGVFDNDLIVGGAFEFRGDLQVNHIARYNGTQWASMGDGFDSAVFVLAEFEGELIAGGNFQSSGGNPLNRIARWDGAAWQPMGDGFDGAVNTLVVYEGNLIAGGAFTDTDDTQARRLARWTGSHWEEFGGGANGEVYALANVDGVLVAGGAFTAIDQVGAAGVARWTGDAWEAYGLGVSGCSGSGCLPTVLTITQFDGELIIGGTFLAADGVGVNGIARWRDGGWGSLDAGLGDSVSAYVGALLADNGVLLAGGLFEMTDDGSDAANVAIWTLDVEQQ